MHKVLLATVLVTSGCGTLFNKKTITVEVEAGASIDGDSGTVEIDQEESHTITYADGSRCTIDSGISAGYFILDLFTTGPIGIIVDAVTGGWKISKSDCRGVVAVD